MTKINLIWAQDMAKMFKIKTYICHSLTPVMMFATSNDPVEHVVCYKKKNLKLLEFPKNLGPPLVCN